MPEPRTDLLALLAPVTKALRAIEDAAAERQGLTMWQYAVLAVAVATPGLNQGEISARLDYSANRIIADLDRLEQRRLVRRRRGTDRRSNAIEATASGERLMRRIQADIHAREDELLEDLDPAQQKALRSAAAALAASVRVDRSL